jgi:hypothetical protein
VPLELSVIELELQRKLITSNLCLASIYKYCEIQRRLLPPPTFAFRSDKEISGLFKSACPGQYK